MLSVVRRRRLAVARSGVAATEFALIAPIMGIMVIAVFDLGKALILKQQVYNAAHAVAVMASVQAVQADKTTTLTPAAAQTSMSAIYAEMPWLRSGVENGLRLVTLTSINFSQNNPACDPSKTNCTYTPNVAWSVYYRGGLANGATNSQNFLTILRPCGPQVAVAPDYPINPYNEFSQLKTLNINNPDPVVVADVVYVFTPYLPPILNKFLSPQMLFEATVMWPVRSISPNAPVGQQYTTYNLSNASDGGAGVKCPGYD